MQILEMCVCFEWVSGGGLRSTQGEGRGNDGGVGDGGCGWRCDTFQEKESPATGIWANTKRNFQGSIEKENK